MNTILFILLGIAIGLVFNYLRGKIFNQVKKNFDKTKFIKGFKWDGEQWGKKLNLELDPKTWIVRLTIMGLILGVVYCVGEYQGKLGKPVQIDLAYEKEFKLKLDGDYLYKPKNSQELTIIDEQGEVIKEIKVKDIPELKKKLRPFGFQIVPIFVAGGGIGDGIEGELGAGVSWLRYFQWRIDNFLTNYGIYLGTSYRFQKLENSAVGIAIGKAYKGANRILLYWRWRF